MVNSLLQNLSRCVGNCTIPTPLATPLPLLTPIPTPQFAHPGATQLHPTDPREVFSEVSRHRENAKHFLVGCRHKRMFVDHRYALKVVTVDLRSRNLVPRGLKRNKVIESNNDITCKRTALFIMNSSFQIAVLSKYLMVRLVINFDIRTDRGVTTKLLITNYHGK